MLLYKKKMAEKKRNQFGLKLNEDKDAYRKMEKQTKTQINTCHYVIGSLTHSHDI